MSHWMDQKKYKKGKGIDEENGWVNNGEDEGTKKRMNETRRPFRGIKNNNFITPK